MIKKLRLFSTLLLLAVASAAWGETVTLKYSGSTTTNMSGKNEAATLGLSETEWSVVGDQGAASNMPGLNKAGDIRLYYAADGGNTLTVKSLTGATINSISITFTGDNYSNASVLVEGNAVTGDNGTYEINSSEFVIGNANTSNVQVRISQIVITYTPNGTVTPTVATPTFSPAAGVYTSAQSVEISSATDGATVYFTTNGTDPTTSSSVYSEPISVSANTTIKAIAVKDGYDNSAIATATYTIVNLQHAGTEADPYSVADAITLLSADPSATYNNVYVSGIISQIDSYDSQHKSITYWISDDGSTNNQFEVYSGKGLNGADFGAKEDLTVGNSVVVKGTIKKYNSTYEFNYNSIIVSMTEVSYPVINVDEALSLEYDATSGSIDYTVTNFVSGKSLTATSSADWISNIVVGESTVTFTVTVNEGTEDRSATITLSYTGAEDKTVTVTQGHYMAPGEWVLTNLADLTENDVFVIVGTYDVDGSSYAMSNNNGTSAPNAVTVTVVENTLSGEIAENLQWNIGVADDGYTFYPNGTTETWLYCTNTNNGVKVGTNANKTFTVSEEGYLVNAATSRYVGIYNSQDWRCYTSINNNIADQTFSFYKKVENTPQTVNVTIGASATGADGAYYSSVYYSDKALKVPAGVECQTYKMTDGKLSVSKTYAAGSVVPAGQAVVIKASDSGKVTFTVTSQAGEADAESQLLGVDEATTITETGYKYYKLTLNANKDAGTAGFYFDKDSNGGTQINAAANKCYLRIPAAQAAKSAFVFGEETTGINAVSNEQMATDKVYNLSGQRVNKARKGIYIVNGKKVVMK